MTPLQCYQQDLDAGNLQHDAAQSEAVHQLQRVYDELIAAANYQASFLEKIKNTFTDSLNRPVKGLYLWGGVGIGKTYLMDVFFDCLPFSEKRRMHFHVFMRDVHEQLKQRQGEPDPLATIANDIAADTKVLCFDELFVTDIGDAMILANLFSALFHHGVCLVATSNCAPDDLYHNGLQRSRFLPTIDLLKIHTEIFYVDTQVDYRLLNLSKTGMYFHPLDKQAHQYMQQTFCQLSYGKVLNDKVIIIADRTIPVVQVASNVVWFSFDILCNMPRSQVDYLEIAKRYHTVLLSDVSKLASNQDNRARYLINLVDVLYDAHVNLVISAAVPVQEIYTHGKCEFAFARTLSRLQEMQTDQYIHS